MPCRAQVSAGLIAMGAYRLMKAVQLPRAHLLASSLALGAIFSSSDTVAVLQVRLHAGACAAGVYICLDIPHTHTLCCGLHVYCPVPQPSWPLVSPPTSALTPSHPTFFLSQILDKRSHPVLYSLVFGEGVVS